MQKHIMRAGVSLAALAAFGCGKHASAQTAYSQLYVIGDSLSDPGNLTKYVPSAILAATGLVQSPYYNDHFTNTPSSGSDAIYAEYLSSSLKIPLTDLAVGGAYTGTLNTTIGALSETGSNIIPGDFSTVSPALATLLTSELSTTSLAGQVASLVASGTKLNASDLVTVWGGANDYFEMSGLIEAQPTTFDTQAAVLGAVTKQVTITVGNLASDITSLAGIGAKTFLVPLLPNLGDTPSFNTSATSQSLGQTTSEANNAALAATLGSLEGQLGVKIFVVDYYSLLNDAVANPAKYGFTNVTDKCYTTANAGIASASATVCATPNTYLYWDPVHPTTAAQEILSEFALATLNGPNTIGAERRVADIAQDSVFDTLTSRITALRNGVNGLSVRSTDGNEARVGADPDKPASIYILGSYGQGSRDTASNQVGFDYDNTLIGAGLDYRITPHIAIGGLFGYGTTDATLYAGQGSQTLDTYNFALYGVGYYDHWYASASGLFSYLDWSKNDRNTFVAGQVASATPTGLTFGTDIEGGYVLHYHGLQYGPLAGIKVASTSIYAYDENGAVGLNQSVNQQNITNLVAEGGLAVSDSFTAGRMVWAPSLRVAWNHQLGTTDRGITTALTTVQDVPVTTELNGESENWLGIAAGLEVHATQALSGIAEFDATALRSNGEDYAGQLKLKYAF